MITGCPTCNRKTRQIDASGYVGDYHSPPTDGDWAPGRQCVECGSKFSVQKIGKSVRLAWLCVSMVPPRLRWEEPIL